MLICNLDGAEAFKLSPPEFLKSLKSRTTEFTPPGDLVSTFTLPSSPKTIYHIHRSTLLNSSTRALLRNLQILIPLFIEAGTALDLDEEPWVLGRWDVYTLYSRTASSPSTGSSFSSSATASADSALHYSFVGYCTLYRHFYFDTKVSEYARTRLSQFLILPPYQRQGLGSTFYERIVESYLNVEEVREFCVEDPSDVFMDMRDTRDLIRLRKDVEFEALTMADVADTVLTPKSKKSKAAVAMSGGEKGVGKFDHRVFMRRHKMPARQFWRLLEMHLLSQIKAGKKSGREPKKYRLLVKRRIYLQNVDVLGQVDRLERVEKLEETYRNVVKDYERMLEGVERAGLVVESDEEEEEEGEGEDEEDGGMEVEEEGGKRKGKRKEGDDEEKEEQGEQERPVKRARMAATVDDEVDDGL